MFSKFSLLDCVKTLISLRKQGWSPGKHPWTAFSKNVHENIFLWRQLNLNSEITCVLNKATHCMECKREDLLFSTRKSESYMNGQYITRIEQSLLLGWNYRMWGIHLFLDLSCAVCSGDSSSTHFAKVHWCNCSNLVSNQRRGCIHLRCCHQEHP